MEGHDKKTPELIASTVLTECLSQMRWVESSQTSLLLFPCGVVAWSIEEESSKNLI